MSAFLAIIRRDLLLAMRRKSEVLTALFFFIIVVSLFPLGIGPEPALLKKIAPGHPLGGRAAGDHAVAATACSPPTTPTARSNNWCCPRRPSGLLVAGKIAAHWLTSGLPLVLLAPVLGIQFDLDASALGILVVALLLGTPLLSLIGAIGAALTLGVRGGGVLLCLLVLPLYIPALIFGAGAVEAHISGLGAGGHLSLLAALLALAAFFAPWATTAALRISLE